MLYLCLYTCMVLLIMKQCLFNGPWISWIICWLWVYMWSIKENVRMYNAWFVCVLMYACACPCVCAHGSYVCVKIGIVRTYTMWHYDIHFTIFIQSCMHTRGIYLPGPNALGIVLIEKECNDKTVQFHTLALTLFLCTFV